jgi:hypothetical protein
MAVIPPGWSLEIRKFNWGVTRAALSLFTDFGWEQSYSALS